MHNKNIFIFQSIILLFFVHSNFNYSAYTFNILYKKSKKRIITNSDKVKSCLNNSYIKECNKYFNDISFVMDRKTVDIYIATKMKLFDSIYRPHFTNVDIIVAIPCSPTQLSGRIAIRNTYAKVKRINNFRIKYIFTTGLSKSSSYKLEYLKYESHLYNDIIVFNMINSYENLTVTMFSLYKWIIENVSSLKYFIRVNTDTLFIPHNLKKILSYKYDFIGEFYCEKKENVTYPQGSFYILSLNALIYIYNNKEKVKMNRFDDVIYGKILKLKNNLTIKDIYNNGLMYSQAEWKYKRDDIKSSFAIHPVNPQVVYYLYNMMFNRI